MADRTFWFEVHSDEAIRGLERADQTIFGGVHHILDQLADTGVNLLQANVPVYSSYTWRHIERTTVAFRPGGAGGGGHWEAMLGVKAGTSRHPLYVHEGTGVYGFFKRPYTGLGTELVSVPGRKRAVRVPTKMYFYGSLYGRVIARRSVKGQEPNRFLYRTFMELQPYAMARLLAR